VLLEKLRGTGVQEKYRGSGVEQGDMVTGVVRRYRRIMEYTGTALLQVYRVSTGEQELYRGTGVAQGCRSSTGLLWFKSSIGVYGVVYRVVQ
jgi:hypothetical protein